MFAEARRPPASHRSGLGLLTWNMGSCCGEGRPSRHLTPHTGHEGGAPLFSQPQPLGRGPRTHRLQVVPGAGGEVASHLHLPGLEHRRDEQSPSPQELAVHSPGAGVLREPSHETGVAGGGGLSAVCSPPGPCGGWGPGARGWWGASPGSGQARRGAPRVPSASWALGAAGTQGARCFVILSPRPLRVVRLSSLCSQRF